MAIIEFIFGCIGFVALLAAFAYCVGPIILGIHFLYREFFPEGGKSQPPLRILFPELPATPLGNLVLEALASVHGPKIPVYLYTAIWLIIEEHQKSERYQEYCTKQRRRWLNKESAKPTFKESKAQQLVDDWKPDLTEYAKDCANIFNPILGLLPNLSGETFKTTVVKLASPDPAYLYPPIMLGSEPWLKFLNFPISFSIPQHTRFEHTLVVGSTGSGKTQLLQRLIYEDLKTNAAVIVMAPKGSLISNIAQLKQLPEDRMVLIQMDRNIPINIFDMEGERNSIVELILFIFAAIKIETTGKQTGFLTFCINLCLEIPDATLLTLRTIVKNNKLAPEHMAHVSKLNIISQEFFNDDFSNTKMYSETREQILARLNTLFSNDTVVRILSHPRTHFDLTKTLDEGKVILIDTSIEKLGESGSSLMGAFFIAIVALAAQRRGKNPRPVFFYIDEAATYLTEKVESILERARESKVGLTLAHQQLSQLRDKSPKLESSVITNTSTKFIGGVNYDDASKLARELGVEATALNRQNPLHFHLRSKGFNTIGIPISITPGLIEGMPQRPMPRPTIYVSPSGTRKYEKAADDGEPNRTPSAQISSNVSDPLDDDNFHRP